MKTYEYYVDDNTGMACVVDTTYSFQDECDLMDYAQANGWKMTRIDAPAYAFSANGELREDMATW